MVLSGRCLVAFGRKKSWEISTRKQALGAPIYGRTFYRYELERKESCRMLLPRQHNLALSTFAQFFKDYERRADARARVGHAGTQ